MKKCRVTFLPSERIFDLEDGDTILDAAMKGGVYINASCGGNSSCGKCRIRIVEGNVVSSHHPKITRADYDRGYRLACKSKPYGNVVVEVPLESQIDRSIIKGRDRKPLILSTSGIGQIVKELKVEPSFFKVYVELPEPTADDNVDDFARLRRELRGVLKYNDFALDLKVLRRLSEALREGKWRVTITVTERKSSYQIIHVEPGNEVHHNCSIVIDIGTTTVCGQILDLAGGSKDIYTMGESSDYNAQVQFGDDVISRIIYSRKKDGLKRLQEAVVLTINGIIKELLKENDVDAKEISHLVFAGNTTMTHLLLGLNPRNIMLAPYTPVSTVYPLVLAKQLGINIGDHVCAQFFPCVSSYVGGDIVAGVIGSGMSRSEKVTLFMDIGTNGEIVLGNKDWLVCASCSAGPAFEGGGIQFGVRAEKGAIEQIRINPASYEPMIITIGKAKAKGICGSGLIDGVAELLAAGILDRNGKFRKNLITPRVRQGENGYEYVVVFSENTQIKQDIVITEVDLNNFIRAKAAVYAGCKVLLDSVGLLFKNVEKIIIAGGFGHYIDIEKAQVIGLLPELPLERFVFIGNGSLLGARLFSLSKGFVSEAEDLSNMMTNIELSNSQRFMDEFVAASFLPHTDDKAFPKVLKSLEGISASTVNRSAVS
jgi:uncharacterized 2Fe-2S/4Fe-4S cluster protein (DUF4445 family)